MELGGEERWSGVEWSEEETRVKRWSGAEKRGGEKKGGEPGRKGKVVLSEEERRVGVKRRAKVE